MMMLAVLPASALVMLAFLSDVTSYRPRVASSDLLQWWEAASSYIGGAPLSPSGLDCAVPEFQRSMRT